MTQPLDEFIRFVAPDLQVTEKHGSHNQQDHAGKRGGGEGRHKVTRADIEAGKRVGISESDLREQARRKNEVDQQIAEMPKHKVTSRLIGKFDMSDTKPQKSVPTKPKKKPVKNAGKIRNQIGDLDFKITNTRDPEERKRLREDREKLAKLLRDEA